MFSWGQNMPGRKSGLRLYKVGTSSLLSPDLVSTKSGLRADKVGTWYRQLSDFVSSKSGFCGAVSEVIHL